MARPSRQRHRFDYWPGFVDALSTMLLVIIFLLTVFMLAQFVLSRSVSGKDSALAQLHRQIAQLTSLLALERTGKAEAQASLSSLRETLTHSEAEKSRLQGLVESGAGQGGGDQVQAELAEQKQLSTHARDEVALLNQQISAMRRQLAAIEEALAASEQRNGESAGQISDLGARLNIALAQRVQELSRYRSDFFGKLRDILGQRQGVRIVGDRFVFETEVLFDSGQALINAQGQAQMDNLAKAIIALEKEIPESIAWILRVDGHTDKRPVSGLFRSNWELSAARAIAVVDYLVAHGVSPVHLAAAGFGEFQPLDTGSGEESLRRNRRIELKLTER